MPCGLHSASPGPDPLQGRGIFASLNMIIPVAVGAAVCVYAVEDIATVAAGAGQDEQSFVFLHGIAPGHA